MHCYAHQKLYLKPPNTYVRTLDSGRTAVVTMVFKYLRDVSLDHNLCQCGENRYYPTVYSSTQLRPSFVTPELNLNVSIKMSQLKCFVESYDLTNRYTWEKISSC